MHPQEELHSTQYNNIQFIKSQKMLQKNPKTPKKIVKLRRCWDKIMINIILGITSEGVREVMPTKVQMLGSTDTHIMEGLTPINQSSKILWNHHCSLGDQ